MNLLSPITGNTELDTYLFNVKMVVDDLIYLIDQQNKIGFTGTFVAGTKTVTVKNGIITSVV